MKSDVLLKPLPGNLNYIISGGTRNKIKFSRPWQKPLETLIDRDNCPFETKPQQEINLYDIPKNWKLLPNIFTPHQHHYLAVPNHCWQANKLQRLGGTVGIANALKTFLAATRHIPDGIELSFFIHIGWSAGQNIGHPHWHIMQTKIRQPFEISKYRYENKTVIQKTAEFTTIADGARSGQCLIIPNYPTLFRPETIPSVVSALFNIINLGNKKFVTPDHKLPPDFSAGIRISNNKVIRYAYYCPILNLWGGPEYIFTTLENGPFTLPWTHELTAKYLRDRL